MAELLITAADTAAEDGPGKWYAARIVYVGEDGHQWGREERPPVFNILKVPGVSKADADEYLQEWRHDPTYTVVNSQLAVDGFRIRLESEAVNSLGKGAIMLDQVRAFFTRWGATVQSATQSSVTFDITIFKALTSGAFWDQDVSGVTFSETEYNQSTGSHLIEVVTPAVTEAQIERVCQREGVVYVPPRSFIATRDEAREKLQADIASRFRDIMIDRRRWYISATGMQALADAGGVLTVTAQQLVANLRDGFAD